MLPQSFAQTPEMAKVRERLGWKVFSSDWGFLSFGGGHIKVCESFCGPVLDYDNFSEVQEFTKCAKKLAKEQGATYLRCNPNLLLKLRDKSGAVIKSYKNTNFEQAGWKYQGETVGNAGQPRFFYVRDLTESTYEEAKKSFKNTVRTEIRRALENDIEVRELIGDISNEEFADFKAVMEETAERQGFTDRMGEYYRALKAEFGEKVHFMASFLDIQKATILTREKIASLQEQLVNAKKDGQKAEFSNQIAAAQKRLAVFDTLPENDRQKSEVMINAGVFIENGNPHDESAEMVYLFGGTKSAYLGFSAVYLLQEVMMKKCYELGIRRYNFYGISGIFDKSDPSFGVLEFKQAFGGHIEELIGEYILPVKKAKYWLYNRLRG